MALNPNDLANDLKAAFSTSTDAPTKALTDAHWDQMAVIITTHILRAKVMNVVTDPNSGAQLPPFPNLT